MIKGVKVWSKSEMSDMLKAGISKYVERGEVAIISILDTDADILCPFHQNILTLHFDDVNPKMAYQYNAGMYESMDNPGRNLLALTANQADKIVSFIDDVKNREEKVNLFVHCSAGISRSGAVGKFAAEYSEISMQIFHDRNPNIMPNGWVESMLWQEVNNKKYFG